MTKVFSEAEVVRLCTAIRNHRSLYDPSDPNFGKSLANKAVWDEIAEMFADKQFTADDIKLKWKNLRDTMALLLRKKNRDPNSWRFYEYCSFLNDYERPPRKNARKIPSSSSLLNTSMKSSASDNTDTGDEPPEKQMRPTMVVNAKTDDLVEPSDTSRDSNFEDTHDSLLLKHFVSHGVGNSVTALVQTPISQVQSPYPSMHTRDLYDVFGEEIALRLRSIDASGHRAHLIHARRRIHEILDTVELELFSKGNCEVVRPMTSTSTHN